MAKKHNLTPQNDPASLGHEKLYIKKWPRWRTVLSKWKRWVATNIHLDYSSPLRRNGPHCVKFFHHIGKILLNLTPGKPFALVKKLSFFENPIESYVLLEGGYPLSLFP
jgi:hypothetical protein